MLAAPLVRPTARPMMRAAAPSAKHTVAATDSERLCWRAGFSGCPSTKHSGWHTSSMGSSG